MLFLDFEVFLFASYKKHFLAFPRPFPTIWRWGQQDLARQLLAKMAELNQKLGANMAQLEEPSFQWPAAG